MKRFFFDACVFARADDTIPVIAVSACGLPVPSLRARDMNKSQRKLQELRVSRIINVCHETVPGDDHLAWYANLGIAFCHVPIDDDETVPVPATFWPAVLAAYQVHDPATGIVLIHCQAGVNRSMLAAAMLLWTTTPNALETWPMRGHDLIAYMHEQQQAQRGGYSILTNTAFRHHVHVFCSAGGVPPPSPLLDSDDKDM